ncbi:NUDIX domain-containing protein [Apiospora rasikravindrae]|uniref:NUDIX domain-containing protein n=1 Tax=Apiospora rasikravindrae TaxID=990691 RepID=A0ABR1U2G1_9PEZI
MASSSKVYDGTQYVESCGAVLFDDSKTKVCLLLRRPKGDDDQKAEWVLPQGRRNCGEHRYAAALREVEEVIGYACHLQSLIQPMVTRAPAAPAARREPEAKPRPCRTYTEHFMVTHRTKEGEDDGYLKLIYWFLAVADAQIAAGEEETFTPRFLEPDEALETVTFSDERKVLEEGIRLMRGGC